MQSGRNFQAVVAASDLLAIGAIRLPAERGIHVPVDVAVVGFNDSEEGRLVRPPLTSVSLPFYDQGRQSAETLPAVLAGNDMPDSVTLESELLVRQSCGCPSWSERLAIAEFAAVSQSDPKSALKRTQKQLEAQIGKVIHNRGVAATWAKQLLDTFQSEIEGSGIGRFPEEL